MKKLTMTAIGALMLAAPAGAEMATLNGAEIYYTSVGEGVPVMVMHGGLGLDHTYLRPYFDALENRAQVIYWDHLGNGRSERPADFGELTFDRFVADTEALRQHLGLEKVIVIGHSYGGFIAQEYAAAHSENLVGLVLANTVPVFDYAPTLSGTDEQMAALGEAFSRPMASDGDFQAIWTGILPMYFKEFDADAAAVADAKTHYSHAGWNAANGLLATFNTLEKIGGVDVPTLVIGGRHDGITPPEPGAERLDGLMPNSTLTVFENSGHFPFVEEEAQFFEVLNGWMDGL